MTQEAQPSVSLMFLPHFGVFCDLLLNRPTATWNLFVLYNNEKPFLPSSKYFNITRQPAFAKPNCPLYRRRKQPFDVIYLHKMKQFHLLLCCDWSRKITPLSNRMSNLMRASLLAGWKLTAKAELNCEIYKSWRKMLEKSSHFLSSEQPCEPKS